MRKPDGRPRLRADVRELRRLAEELRRLHPGPETETGYLVARLQARVVDLADAMGRAWGE